MKVLIADDHPLFADGLCNLLTSHGFNVVGTARNGVEAIDRARELRPDIILMDIRMPQIDGLAALRLIKAEFPEIKIVILTMSAEDDELFRAIDEGASGYLLKTQDTSEFFVLLEEVSRGEVALSRGLAGRILLEYRRRAVEPPAIAAGESRWALSERQRQVLAFVAAGLTYKEVGAKLCLSERTIKYHMGEIVARLHLEKRAQAIDYARRSGMID